MAGGDVHASLCTHEAWFASSRGAARRSTDRPPLVALAARQRHAGRTVGPASVARVVAVARCAIVRWCAIIPLVVAIMPLLVGH